MVDIAYLGYEGIYATTLLDLPLAERQALLDAPFLPFDGMNEHGLTIGMAAVSGSEGPFDESKKKVDSLMIIREMLDHVRNVDEAIAILQNFNIDWGNGPPLHYLIADASASSVLVEFYEGEVIIIPDHDSWHAATNHLRTTANKIGSSGCSRYDHISSSLTETEGLLSTQDALTLLADVAQPSTQWSVVYQPST
ncbi:MAG: hypothetical protein B6I38_03570, partial [Anaerolineaceae bacterium 4572_5.1]